MGNLNIRLVEVINPSLNKIIITENLEELVKRLCAKYSEMERAHAELSYLRCVSSRLLPHFSEVIREGFEQWTESMKDHARKEATHSKYEEFRRFSDWDDAVNCLSRNVEQDSDDETIKSVVSTLPVSELIRFLGKEAEEIEERIFEKACKVIGSQLGFYTHGHNTSPLDVKRVGGRFKLEQRHYGTSGSQARMNELIQALNEFERESDEEGLKLLAYRAVDEINNSEEGKKFWDDRWPKSRTKIEIEGVGVATFFNEKIVYAIEEDIFLSLYSFHKNYAGQGMTREIKLV